MYLSNTWKYIYYKEAMDMNVIYTNWEKRLDTKTFNIICGCEKVCLGANPTILEPILLLWIYSYNASVVVGYLERFTM
jgi:hypothetical protein